MIVNADSTHIPLASNTVQCIVTSPPYYMMRDYQTATWVGFERHLPADCSGKIACNAGDVPGANLKIWRM